MRGGLAIVLGILGLILGWLCASDKPSAAAPPPPAAANAPPVASAPAPASASAVLAADGRLVVEGSVADDAARQSILRAAQAAVGAERVVDRLGLDPRLGAIAGLALRGDVGSDAVRAAIGESMQKALGAVRVDNQLRVSAALAQQTRLREFLATRTIEFGTGSAVITPRGLAVLDELVPLVQAEAGTRIEVQGHTDNVGDAAANRQLSEARAQATRAYLVRKGVTPERLTAKGYGDTRPLADNATLDGRQKNRRIELAVEEK